jgi:hypothetical protein
MHSAEKMEQKDNRLRCSRRPEALARIREGVAAADAVGWPVNVPDGLEELKAKSPPSATALSVGLETACWNRVRPETMKPSLSRDVGTGIKIPG